MSKNKVLELQNKAVSTTASIDPVNEQIDIGGSGGGKGGSYIISWWGNKSWFSINCK